MKELTSKKYLCVIRGTEDFITNDGTQYRGYYLVAADKLATIREALEDYSIDEACIFRRGSEVASHAVCRNEAGGLTILRTWRGSIFNTTPPACIWVGDMMEDSFNELLDVAKGQVEDGLAHVYEV